MIWATVSSWSCFSWQYRASPSLAAKSMINLISVLIIWWCPCVDLLLFCWKRVFTMTSAFSWQNSVSLCPALFFTPRSNLLLQVSLDFLLLHSSPLWWKGLLFLVLVLEGLVGFHRTVQLYLLGISGWAISWITVTLNGLPWQWTKIILLFLRLHPSTTFWTLCWQEGCFSLSKGFLP